MPIKFIWLHVHIYVVKIPNSCSFSETFIFVFPQVSRFGQIVPGWKIREHMEGRTGVYELEVQLWEEEEDGAMVTH